ncbi:MAG TPA: hypothetical protein VIK01_00520 [Polyangiaceae bacterium]
MQFFSGGDSLTVEGAGGADLPAFTAHASIAPSDVVITAPTCPELICPEFDRLQDLAVTWTGGGAGQVRASFETVPRRTQHRTNVEALGAPLRRLAKSRVGPSAGGAQKVTERAAGNTHFLQ